MKQMTEEERIQHNAYCLDLYPSELPEWTRLDRILMSGQALPDTLACAVADFVRAQRVPNV